MFNEFKDANHDFYFATHLIIGFPGETEEDLDLTIDFVKQTRLDEIGIFLYSDREGAEAVHFKDKVSASTLQERKVKIEQSIKSFNNHITVNFNV